MLRYFLSTLICILLLPNNIKISSSFQVLDIVSRFYATRGLSRDTNVSVVFVWNGFRFTKDSVGEASTLAHLASCRPSEAKDLVIHAFAIE